MFSKALGLYRESFSGLSREIWLLSGVMLINRAGTMVIPFLSVYLTQQLGFSLAQTGWVMSSFGAGSVAGSLIGGKLSDRVGFYQVQFWALLLSGFSFIALSLFTSFYAMCLAVFVSTTIADAFRPANFTAIAAYSRAENRTRAIALLRMAINLGWAVGPALGGFLAIHYGYHFLFWADGLTCIAAAIIFRFALPPRFAEEEEEGGAEEGATKALPRSVYHDKPYLLFLFLTLLNGLAFMQMFSAFPVFLKQEVFLNEGQIGALLALNGLTIGLLEMPLIFILEKRVPALKIISFGTLLIGAAFLLFNAFGPWPGIALASMLLLTFGEMFSLPFLSTRAIGFAGRHNRGAYMSLFSTTYSLSHILAPNIGLQMAGIWGFPALWYVIAGITVLAALGFQLVYRRENQRPTGKH